VPTPVAPELITSDFFCPLCGDLVDHRDTVWRDHDVRGARVRFEVCRRCQDRSLCPANYHGVHSEIIDDIEEGGADETLGYCSACRTEFRWYEGAWHDVKPPPIAADINVLNARLQNGDIGIDEYVRELAKLTEIEGSTPAADGESERKD